MSNVFDPPPAKLKAITINGAILVESEADFRRREERRKQRKSRWDKSSDYHPSEEQTKADMSKALACFPNINQNSSFVREKFEAQERLKREKMLLQPTIDASQMDDKSQKIYLLHLEIQDKTRNLAKPDLGIPADPRDRSPSPEPIYNNEGVRINTRLERTRANLIAERNNAVAALKELDPTYVPPIGFHFKNAKLEDRVILPIEEYPHINFMGLILGPRGHFLEELKKETKCTIIIRGKGSLRSGMTGITKAGRIYEGLDDPLHAYITGSTAEDVQGAVKKIQDLVNLHIYDPESEQAVALRARHMHELAMLNGTLKEIDMKCLNCGRLGHKSWECDERPNFSSSVICSACGGVGHLTSDCKSRRPGAVFAKKASSVKPEVIDKEYEAFISDLGGGNKSGSKNNASESSVSSTGGTGDLSKCFEPPQKTLMLTNGSAAPGAASAFARAKNNPHQPQQQQQQQKSTSSLHVIGKSIFGGNMTKMTSGFKTKIELELEREKKKQEFEHRHVPMEWQVERYEKTMNKRQEEYIDQLEQYCTNQKKKRQDSLNVAKSIVFAPPPPPPPPPGMSSHADDNDGLPSLIGNPMKSLR